MVVDSAVSAAGDPDVRPLAFFDEPLDGGLLPDAFPDFLAVQDFVFVPTMSCPNSLRTIAHPNRVWRLIFSPMILPCPSRDNGNRNREFPERGAPDSDRRDH
jgi:hypothetical protein